MWQQDAQEIQRMTRRLSCSRPLLPAGIVYWQQSLPGGGTGTKVSERAKLVGGSKLHCKSRKTGYGVPRTKWWPLLPSSKLESSHALHNLPIAEIRSMLSASSGNFA